MRVFPIPSSMHRIFLLSPAHSGGRRAAMLMREGASFDLARQLQSGLGTLGEVFAFCSGLYFRGKLAYASKFAQAPPGFPGAQVITTCRGLVPAGTSVSLDDLRQFAAVPIDSADDRFIAPLRHSVQNLSDSCEVVLLGSIATGKYVDCLLPLLGERLLFPAEFVGRGDMSRGGLMLRCTARGEELHYIPVAGAMRRGRRAAKIETMDLSIVTQPAKTRSRASQRSKQRQ